MIDLIILIALIVGGYFLWALFLWLGARLMRVPDVSYPRALAATLAVMVLNALTYAAFSWLDLFNSPLAQILVEGGIGLLLVWLVVRIMLRTSFLRAIGSWSLTLIPAAGMLAFAFLVLR